MVLVVAGGGKPMVISFINTKVEKLLLGLIMGVVFPAGISEVKK